MTAKTVNLDDLGASRLRAYLRFFRLMLRDGGQNHYVLMHFDPIVVGLVAGYLRPDLRRRVTNVYHTDLTAYHDAQRGIRKIVFKLLLGRLKHQDTVFSSKEMMVKAQKDFLFSRCRVIYSAFDCVADRAVLPSALRRGKTVVLGVVARLHAVKNIDLSIRVVCELRSRGYDVQLDIYGSGPEQASLMNYAQRLHATGFISFKGFLQDTSIAYQAIDGLICLSSIEGWGLTILESIRAGKPVFHTDCSCGPREIMSPGSDPWVKTATLEETDVGFLVRPLMMPHAYAGRLREDETLYVDYLELFIDRVQNNRFSMNFDFDRFSDERIRAGWMDALSTCNAE